MVVYETVFSLKVASFFQKNFQSLTEEILAFVFDILNYGGVGLVLAKNTPPNFDLPLKGYSEISSGTHS